MKKKHFDVGTDGFYGAYWKCKSDSDCAMIAMIGDDSEDYLARTSVKWLHKLGVNVKMCIRDRLNSCLRGVFPSWTAPLMKAV